MRSEEHVDMTVWSETVEYGTVTVKYWIIQTWHELNITHVMLEIGSR
jgi:hypothetical protein